MTARQKKVFLVGYRASGKSSLGRRLAGELGWSFCDTDAELEARNGRAVGDLFREWGEERFREAEGEVLEDVVQRPGRWVVATGGGILERERNVTRMREGGRVIFLSVPAEVIQERLRRAGEAAGGRPSLTGAGAIEEVPRVLARREALYRGAADEEVEASGAMEEVVRRVREILEGEDSSG